MKAAYSQVRQAGSLQCIVVGADICSQHVAHPCLGLRGHCLSSPTFDSSAVLGHVSISQDTHPHQILSLAQREAGKSTHYINIGTLKGCTASSSNLQFFQMTDRQVTSAQSDLSVSWTPYLCNGYSVSQTDHTSFTEINKIHSICHSIT